MTDPLRAKSARLLAVVPLIALLGLAACARVGAPEGWSGGAISGDTLYIGTIEGDLRALDLRTEEGAVTGDLLWIFDLKEQSQGAENPADAALYGTPVISGDRLYVGGYDGYLYALSLDTGELLWDEPVGDADHIVGGPAVADGVVLVGSSDGNLYAFDESDRFLKWSFPTGNKVWSTPVVAEGVVFFGSQDHNVYAVELAQGTEVWRFPTKGAVTAAPVVVAGRVYVGSFDSVFYAIDAATGVEVARFEGAESWYWGGAVASDGAIYAPSLDGSLYALDLDTLEPVWPTPLQTDGPIIGSPVIVGDRIAVPSRDGGVYLVRLVDGTFEDQCGLDGKLRASLAARGDVIYVSADHSVRELKIDGAGNLVGGWEHRTDTDEDPVSGRWRCG